MALQQGLRVPTAFESSLVLASGSSISIGGSDASGEGYHLAGSLRDELVQRAWLDGSYFAELPLRSSDVEAEFRQGGSLEPAHLYSDAGRAVVSTCGNREPVIGDLSGSLRGLRVEGVSIFAQQTAYVQREGAEGDVAKTLGSAFGGSSAVTQVSWPDNRALHDGITWLAPADGVGFILPQTMSKAEAVSKLRADTLHQFTWGLALALLLSFFSIIWSCCGLGFTGSMSAFEDRADGVAVVCAAGWSLLLVASVAMLIGILLSILVSPLLIVSPLFMSIVVGMLVGLLVCLVVAVVFKSGTLHSLLEHKRPRQTDESTDSEETSE